MRLALALVSLVAFAGTARAQGTAAEDLAAIREQVLHASYRPAAAAVDVFLARSDLSAADRNAGLEVDAIVSLALRDDAGATAALTELYARDPGHRLLDPDASPVVQTAFARARESAVARSVTIETSTPETLARRATPVITLTLAEGGDAVDEVRISYRHVGEDRWATVVAAPEGGEVTATVHLVGETDAETVEYYAEALAPSSTVIGTLGSATEPRSVTVPAAVVASTEPTPAPTSGGNVAEEPWFWILIGVVVVGAGVGIGVGVAVSQPGATNGDLGNVTLPLVSF